MTKIINMIMIKVRGIRIKIPSSHRSKLIPIKRKNQRKNQKKSKKIILIKNITNPM